MYDICIVGAGINGALLAYELSKYELRILVLEKDGDVANEATSANSAIIHSGHEPKPNTLKAKLNVEGNRLWEALSHELRIDFERIGAMVVAVNDAELPALHTLYRQAKDRLIPAYLWSKAEALEREPNLSDQTIQVLELPSTAILSPWEATIAAFEVALHHGVELKLNHEVQSIEANPQGFEIRTQHGSFTSQWVINSAGVFADDVYRMVSPHSSQHIVPRRGEYFVLDRAKPPHVSRVIYPLPNHLGKGVLVVPTIHHNLLIGPNSEVTHEKTAKDTTRNGLAYVQQEAAKIVKNLPMHTVIRTYVGLRASLESYDFVIEEANDVPHFINLMGIDSPGLAAAPAIAQYVVEELLKPKHPLVLKKDKFTRQPWIHLDRLSLAEKQHLFQTNPQFGKMVCRCELISEGEVVDVINRPAGAKTLKAIKRRVRAGAGRCQGGFCEPKLVNILARELNIDPSEVRYDGEHSKLLKGKTKG